MFPTSQGQENKHELARKRNYLKIIKNIYIAAILQFLNSNIHQQTHVLSLKDSAIWQNNSLVTHILFELKGNAFIAHKSKYLQYLFRTFPHLERKQ